MTVKRRAGWAGLASVASILWLLAADVAAQEPHQAQRGRMANGGGPQRMMPAEQRSEQSVARDNTVPDGASRMSPEERRQLRRDVHEAGRDIYPDRAPRGRREQRRQ